MATSTQPTQLVFCVWKCWYDYVIWFQFSPQKMSTFTNLKKKRFHAWCGCLLNMQKHILKQAIIFYQIHRSKKWSYLELSSCSIIIGLLIFYTFGKEKTIDIKYNNTVQIKCHILNGASDIISPSPINDRFVYHQKSEIMPNTSLTKYTRFHLTVFPIL